MIDLDRWAALAHVAPLHERVARYLSDGVDAGEYPPRRPMPSTRDLAAQLGVSRTTVRTAYDRLVASGLLIARERAGFFPANAPAQAPPADRSAPDVARRLVRRPPALPGAVDVDYLEHPFPFLTGQPEPGTFPSRAWLQAAGRAMSGRNLAASLIDPQEGDDPLLVRQIIDRVLAPKGVRAEPEQVLITCGTQQGLFLLTYLLVGERTTVAMGSPGYVDAERIFSATGAVMRYLPVDGRGVRMPRTVRADLVYLNPSHHNPTNATLSADRRIELLDRAEAEDMLLIEDDFDSEVRFRGAPVRPMAAAGSPRVIYLGTFSKFLAPGVRIGYVVADPRLIEQLRRARHYSTKAPSPMIQRTLALFLESGDHDVQLRRHRVALRGKWEATIEALERHFPWELTDVPTGGLGFWLTGPDGYSATALARRARARGVLVSPGGLHHFTAPRRDESIRLGIASIPQARIELGIRLLSSLV